jgi:hypothetical protein
MRACDLRARAVVEFVASLLGVGSQYLKQAFEVRGARARVCVCCVVPYGVSMTAAQLRTMETKKGLKKGSTYKVPLNFVQVSV